MSLAVGTQVQVKHNHSSITLRGEEGTISEIDGSTYIVQMKNHGERYFGADELVEVAQDIKSWNNYKLIIQLELAIRDRKDADYIMELQNEIFSRMIR